MHNIVSKKIYIHKHHNKYCVPRFFFIFLISCASKHMCVCMCAYKDSFVHTHTSTHKCIFFLCTNMVANYVMHHKTYNGTKGNKSRNAQSKSMGHKKGSNQSDRSKLKRRVKMERYLPVGRIGEDGSSIRVLDHKKKTKRHKKRSEERRVGKECSS